MPLNPALGDAYRNIVVTGSGTPGTSTAHAVDAQFNLDAGFGISLVTDVPNNKVTIVNTGNGTGALTTITDTNASGTFYPIFTRPPPGTQTFTIAGGDYSIAGAPIGASAIRVVGSINDPTGISYAMRAALTGIIAGETLQAIRSSDNATLNYTATGPASYSTIDGNWTIPVNAVNPQTDSLYSITIATGAGEYNAATGTYQMDTMYLDQTTTPLTYNPSTSTITVSNISAGTLNLNSTVSKTYTTPSGVTTKTVSELIQNSSIASGLTGLVVAPVNSNSSIIGIESTPVVTSSLLSEFPSIIGINTIASRSSATDLAANGLLIGTQSVASMLTNLPNTAGCFAVYGTSTSVQVDRGASVAEMTAIRAQSNSTIGGSTSTCSVNSVNVVNGSMSLLAPGRTLNITDATGFNLSSVAIGSGTTVTNYYGLYLASPSVSGSITTGRYGVYSADSSASNYFAGTLNVAGHITVEGVTSTGATGTGKLVFDTSPSVTGLSSNTVLVGANANFTRFPNAVAVVSTVASNQQNESGNIGLIAEAVGAGATRNAGLYGAGYTSGAFSCQGVVGEGHVSAAGDTAPSVGVRGYANDVHTGGTNVGLYGDAAGSTVANYSLYLNSGDIISASSKIWTLVDNTAAALSFDAAGKTGILVVKTTDAAEGVTMSGTLSVTGHVTIEGVTSTGATGTGKLVFDNAPTISGHPTIEGVTSTGATGTGKFVFDNAPTISGHPTIEGVTSTGATGTGKFVFDNAPTISGHPTIEGVTSTGATGTGKFVFDTSPTISGGGHTGITSLGIRDTSAAFDLTLAATSSTALTAGRTLTVDVVNAARTVKLAGNIDIAGTLTTANTFTTSGNFALTLTTTNTTNVTLPTGTVTLYGTGSGTITSSQLATSLSDETGSGVAVFGTNPTITAPTFSNASSTTDADATVDASTTEYYAYIQSASTTTRTINISNLTAGRRVTLYLRNTNVGAKIVNITASTTTTGFAAVNLATANGAVSATSVTLSASSGTAVITVFNANGNLVGGM